MTTPAVTIYTTPPCPSCQMAKAFFKAHGIAYVEKDVARDQEAAREALRKSGELAVPVIDVGGEIVVGFDKPRLAALLGLHS